MSLSASIHIASPSNPRVKQTVKLRQRSERDRLGLALIEGFRELRHAVRQRHSLHTLFFCPDLFLGENEAALIEQAVRQGAQTASCTEKVFRKLSYRDRPDGLLAVAAKAGSSLAEVRIGKDALVVVAESIEKPGNLGAILRSADAVGAAAALVCDPATDINNPNVGRASIGTLFCLPVVETSSAEALAWLRRHRFFIVAASPHAEQIYTRTALPARTAIVVGSEQYGLGKTWTDQADALVRIPMRGQADSLNVASATTLLLYEALRQHSGAQGMAAGIGRLLPEQAPGQKARAGTRTQKIHPTPGT